MTTLTELYAAYGADENAAVAAFANLDPTHYAAWSENAERQKYRQGYRRWISSQTMRAERDVVKHSGQARLFTPPDPGSEVELRARIIATDGTEMDLLSLAGEVDAAELRAAMIRDLKPAATTVARCRFGLALADHIEAESKRLGHPVSVIEVLGVEKAA